MSKKISRKELLKEEDAFLVAASQGAQWAKSNRTLVLAASAAVAVFITAIWGGAEFVRQRDLEASITLEKAYRILDAQVVGADTDVPADPAGDPPTFATEEDRRAALRQELESVIDIAGGTGVGYMARFYLADLEEDAGNLDEALKEFQALVSDLSGSDPLFFLAVERAAYLQERQGDREAALATLAKLAGRDALFYADVASYHQARLHLRGGNTDAARQLLEGIEKNHPDSLVIPQVKEQLDAIGRSPKEGGEDETTAKNDTQTHTAEAGTP